MEKVRAADYINFKPGDIVYVESLGLDKNNNYGPLPKERARLKLLTSIERETVTKDAKSGTKGKDITKEVRVIPHHVVYEEIDKDGKKKEGYLYTVIGVGQFKIYK